MSILLNFRPTQDDMPTDEGSWFAGKAPLALRVVPRSELGAVLQLRYEAYRDQGYDVDDAFKQLDERFDTAPSTLILGAYDADRLVGCVRLCFTAATGPSALPCADYYPAINELAERHRSIVEVSRMSIDPTLKNVSYRTTLYAFLVRAALTASMAADVSMLLVATKPDWVRFYKFMLGFTPIGEPALYPPGNVKITLMGGSVQSALEGSRNRFFAVSKAEVASMRQVLADRNIEQQPAEAAE